MNRSGNAAESLLSIAMYVAALQHVSHRSLLVVAGFRICRDIAARVWLSSGIAARACLPGAALPPVFGCHQRHCRPCLVISGIAAIVWGDVVLCFPRSFQSSSSSQLKRGNFCSS